MKKLLLFITLLFTFFISSLHAQVYCASTALSPSIEYISNVTSGVFSNSTGRNFYSDYRSLGSINTVFPSTSFNITVTVTDPITLDDVIYVYADWNHDGDFIDAGENPAGTVPFPVAGVFSVGVAVPATALSGFTNIRIKMGDPSNGTPLMDADPCQPTFYYGEVEDYQITVGTLTACAGAPAASNTISSANPVCPSANFTLSLSTAYVFSGITYQWQSATDAAFTIGLTNLGTASIQVTSQTTDKYYRCRITCAGITTISTPLLVTTSALCYCTVAGSNSDYYINNLATTGGVANITNNNSGYSAGGYGNFTNLAVSQVSGNSVNITANFGSSTSYTFGVGVWVDWNQDGDFVDAGEQVYNSGAYVTSISATFTVPLTALTGNTRMRVVANYFSTTPSPCSTPISGEIEDYTFTVIPLTPCAGTPTSTTTNSNVTTICAGNNVSLSLGILYINSGITYQWQSSATGVIYSNIAGATTSTYTATPAATTYYQCLITCTNGGASTISTPALITVNNPILSSTTPATRCGNGTLTLAATGTGGVINWYASAAGGSSLGTGPSFTTPSLSASTNYYASVNAPGGTTETGGRISSTGVDGSTIFTASGIVFTADVNLTLNSTIIYPTGTGTVTIALYNSSGVEIASTTAIAVTGTGIATPVTVPLGFYVPAGNNYRLFLKAYTGITGLIRDFTNAYPYASTPTGIINVTSGMLSAPTPNTTNYFFYSLNATTGCTSGRTLVTATVNTQPTAVTVTPVTSIICAGTTQTIAITGGSYSGATPLLQEFFETYPTANFGITGANVTPATNTTYFAQGAKSVLLTHAISSTTGAYAQLVNTNLSTYTSAQVSFSHICALEGSFTTYDAGYVQYSANGGTTWTTFPTTSYASTGTLMTTVSGTSVSGTIFSTKSYSDWTSQFTGSTSTPGTAPATSLWKTETINVPAAALTNQFRIRFLITSDASANYYGWLIDNVVISGTGPISAPTTWTPITELFTNLAATIPYTTGAALTTVYAKPTTTRTYTGTATAPGGCTSTNTSAITVKQLNTWGGINTNWNDPINWCPAVPTIATNVLVPAGLSIYPILISGGATALCKDLAIAAGASLTINTGAAMNSAGNFANSGTIANNGTIQLNGTTAQTFPGNAGTITAMSRLQINNTAGITINKSFSISTELIPTAGVLALGNFDITILSSYASTASVSAIGATANFSYGTGKFIVERFINTGTNALNNEHLKSWQFLSVPTVGQTIRQSWQENQIYTAGRGAWITSQLGTAAGFDATSLAPSMKYYTAASNVWTGVTGTSINIANATGYMLFVRGDRSVNNTTVTIPNNTTLSTKGILYSPSNLPPVSAVAAGKFQSVGNPYASAIDFTLITKPASPAVDDVFYVWDPLLVGLYGVGGYQVITGVTGWKATPGGTSMYDNVSNYKVIQSGQAFFVHATGAGGNISFTEAVKVNGSRLTNRVNSNKIAMLSTNLFTTDADPKIADGNRVVFSNGFNNSYEALDALKIMNGGENFAISSNGKQLGVEARANPVEIDTIHFYMTNLRPQKYQLRFEPENMQQLGLHKAYLIDRFENTATTISMTDNSIVTINITTDAASSAWDRFILVFKLKQKGGLIFNETSIARKTDKSAIVKWNTENEYDVNEYEVEMSTDNISFHSIAKKDAQNNTTNKALYEDEIITRAANTFAYYRIKANVQDGKLVYSRVVKLEATEMLPPTVSISPNPVLNKEMQVAFADQPNGIYNLQLINKLGEIVYTDKVGISSKKTIVNVQLKNTIPAGVYQLQITNGDGYFKVLQVVLL